MGVPLDPATAALVRRVRESVIGEGAALATPFGTVPVVYCDWTASGRSLGLVEDAVRRDVLPWYANTHSEASGTGRVSTALREQARAVVRRSAGGGDDAAVVFCGSGATAATDRLVTVLGLKTPVGGAAPAAGGDRPVVFVGPYEHHSNELAWRESRADVVVIGEDERGGIDAEELQKQLVRCAGRPLIGSFSAASNVTGVVSDVDGISRLLHAHGALACWDYAAGGPYLDVAFDAPRGAHRDAVFLSPHKFVGGPGTPGVLVVRRSALARWAPPPGPRGRVPAVPGGGTVSYVGPRRHVYLDDVEHREEGGTPDVVGSVRAGLVFQLKDAVGVPAIRTLEDRALRRMVAAWSAVPQLELLGRPGGQRLPIASFLVRAPSGRYLHHGFVVALLNDLFGVQARGGCSCAGPYGHRLLAVDDATSEAHAALVAAGYSGAKPGWVRVSASWFTGDDVLEHLLDAVTAVARHGWRLLPQYRFDARTGAWAHRDAALLPPVRLGLDAAALGPDDAAPSLVECRRRAHEVLSAPVVPSDVPGPRLPAAMAALRWFELPEGDPPAAGAVLDLTAGARPDHRPAPTAPLAGARPG